MSQTKYSPFPNTVTPLFILLSSLSDNEHSKLKVSSETSLALLGLTSSKVLSSLKISQQFKNTDYKDESFPCSKRV